MSLCLNLNIHSKHMGHVNLTTSQQNNGFVWLHPETYGEVELHQKAGIFLGNLRKLMPSPREN